MAGNFAPSVNIARDVDREINYILTPNAKVVFEELEANYRSGHRCFTIVGAYGTGKSAFMWAFERTLSAKKDYFNSSQYWSPLKTAHFQFEHIIGEFTSLSQVLAERFLPDVPTYTVNDILIAIEQKSAELNKQSKGLAIVIDEFGKFLEYAAKHSPEQELYLIQQLAELLSDQRKESLLITVLHQDFGGYALNLSRVQKEEWTKVKGRLKELTFNEPVEQLLYLASQKLAKPTKAVDDRALQELQEVIEETHLFALNDYFTLDVAKNVYPLDILAASVLAQALQQYGQNERSLFTFLESDDRFGLSRAEAAGFYTLASVYDYLIYHYYAFLTSRFNPHFAQWASIRSTLDRTEAVIESMTKEAQSFVKIIGLLTIFAPGGKINLHFLERYGRIALGIANTDAIIADLEKYKLIRYVAFKDCYILFEGTDLDIELAIDKAGQLVGQVSDVVQHLKQLFTFPLVQANQVSFEKGTPRFFEFRISDKPLLDTPGKEIDGYINLIFSERLSKEDIKAAVGDRKEAILYGVYKNTSQIKELIWEIEKIKKVREENPNDKVARRELNDILSHQVRLLNHYVMGSLSSEDSSIEWFFNGDARTAFRNGKDLNRCLSEICNEVYYQTPNFRSELVNKVKLSSAISTAKKKLLRALVQDWRQEDLGFAAKKYPPEKTIYLGLLKNTGIHAQIEGSYILTAPKEPSFLELWKAGEEFLESTKIGELKVSELVAVFAQSPFKLKQGFIEFWLPVFLFTKRNEFALFSTTGFIANMSAEELELVTKNPEEYTIKAFDVDGIKLDFFNRYRDIIQKEEAANVTKDTFIDTIKPFIVFFKGLPYYAKKTKRLSAESLSLREAIAKAKDPEAVFFEDMPNALGYTFALLQKDTEAQNEYITKLQDCIKELQKAYDQLLNRIDQFIADRIVGCEPQFTVYKAAIQARYQNLTLVQLNQKQRTFLQRLMSALDDRQSWLNSLAIVLLHKPLPDFDDTDEELFFEVFKKAIYQLDGFTDLANANVEQEKEEAYKVEVNSFEDGPYQKIVRLPRQQAVELQEKSKQLHESLSSLDKQQQMLVLTNLLKELIKDGE